MRKILFLLLSLGAFAGCASTPPPAGVSDAATLPAEISPIQAIVAAAGQPQGITGIFRMTVLGAGRQNDWLYLNSEEDYRDQRCLTIALPPAAAHALEEKLGSDPMIFLKGKTIRVNGTAQRTTIWITESGHRTDKYYYQTHVRIADLSQIRIIQ